VSSVFYPNYLPHNAVAERLTHQTADALGLSLSGKTGQKHQIIIASFLCAVKHRDDNTIVWRTGKDNQDSYDWAFLPKVGHSVSLKISMALEEQGFISRITDEGRIRAIFPVELDQRIMDELLSQIGKGKRTPAALFEVNTNLLDIGALAEASFVEANLPQVYLNKAEQPKNALIGRNAEIAHPSIALQQSRQPMAQRTVALSNQ